MAIAGTLLLVLMREGGVVHSVPSARLCLVRLIFQLFWDEFHMILRELEWPECWGWRSWFEGVHCSAQVPIDQHS
jgi:hypothetical protein